MSPRLLITGGPRTGKTHFSNRVAKILGIDAQHSDDLIAGFSWSDASAEVAKWISEPGAWVIEGVTIPRSCRKWLAANPAGKPCDRIYWLTDPWEPLSPGQRAMTIGMATVWKGIAAEMQARGVEFVLLGKPDSLAFEEKRA